MGDGGEHSKAPARFCRSCGAKLADTPGSFCPECGAKLAASDQPDRQPEKVAKAPQKAKGSRSRLWLAIAIAGVAAIGVGAVVAMLVMQDGSDDGSSIPSPSDMPAGAIAVVVDVPAETGTITEAKFDHAMEQAAAEAKLPKVPKPGDGQYEELRDGAMEKLLQAAWVRGQAAEMGISATDEEVAKETKKLREQQFESEAEYQKAIKELHLTQADVYEVMELQVLTPKVEEKVRGNSQEPSDAEVEDYYEEVKEAQFTRPNGDSEPLSKVEDQVKSTLKQQKEEEAFGQFIKDFEERWRSLTVCAPAFVVKGCSNGKRTQQPEVENQGSDLPEAPPAP